MSDFKKNQATMNSTTKILGRFLVEIALLCSQEANARPKTADSPKVK